MKIFFSKFEIEYFAVMSKRILQKYSKIHYTFESQTLSSTMHFFYLTRNIMHLHTAVCVCFWLNYIKCIKSCLITRAFNTLTQYLSLSMIFFLHFIFILLVFLLFLLSFSSHINSLWRASFIYNIHKKLCFMK